MAELVGSGGQVIASEVDDVLAARGGDGAALDPGKCDAMLINVGVTFRLPNWLDRLG